MELSDNARRIMDLRYSRKDEHGNPTETPEQVVARVAANVADVTNRFTAIGDRTTRQEVYERYRDLLDQRLMFPNSPTWTGAGTPLGQLSACFVLPIEDDLGRARAGIYSTLKDAVLIQQTGGGNGFDFSSLRPANAIVSRSMGRASGPVGFLGSYDAVFGTIAQGGSRRGANMAVLRCDHPDVRRFIRAKIEEGKISNFNISVAVTEDFMIAVSEGTEFDLVHNGTVYETIKAEDLFSEIAEDAWKFGDPGLLFIDRANKDNPCPIRYKYEATNPCGEQWLPPYGSCNLGSIALQRFVHYGQNSAAPFIHWDHLAEVIHTSVEFLDDIIDANHYVESVPELADMAKNERRIGLGYMGVADAMAMMGIRYGSADGMDFVSQVTEFLRYHAMLASIDRAKERGPFPWIEGSIYDPGLLTKGFGVEVSSDIVTWKAPSPLSGHVEHVRGWGRPVLDWDALSERLALYGIRNACLLTYAPTGTISNVADCEGSGIECFFALVFERKVMQEGQNISLHYASKLFEQALIGAGYVDQSRRQAIIEQVAAEGGSCQRVGDLSHAIKDAFVVAGDLTYAEHIGMQAAAQVWVDNSISKTINLPHSATPADVGFAYELAHSLGCKGITVYRQGSRSLEVLSASPEGSAEGSKSQVAPGLLPDEERSGPSASSSGWPVITPQPIPVSAAIDGLPTRTFPVTTGFGTLQVYVTEHPDHPGRPFDCRISVGKHGSDKNADVEALARMISIALRSGVSVAAICDQLKGIGGRTVNGFGPGKVLSVADGVGKLLERLYQPSLLEEVLEAPGALSEAPDRGQTCPRCGNASLVFEAGCLHCDVRFGGCGDFTRCD
jgi:ribonucleoside-diphosphate reductase alpha chain